MVRLHAHVHNCLVQPCSRVQRLLSNSFVVFVEYTLQHALKAQPSLSPQIKKVERLCITSYKLMVHCGVLLVFSIRLIQHCPKTSFLCIHLTFLGQPLPELGLSTMIMIPSSTQRPARILNSTVLDLSSSSSVVLLSWRIL